MLLTRHFRSSVFHGRKELLNFKSRFYMPRSYKTLKEGNETKKSTTDLLQFIIGIKCKLANVHMLSVILSKGNVQREREGNERSESNTWRYPHVSAVCVASDCLHAVTLLRPWHTTTAVVRTCVCVCVCVCVCLCSKHSVE